MQCVQLQTQHKGTHTHTHNEMMLCVKLLIKSLSLSLSQMGEMGLTQSVGEDGLRFEVWVRQLSRTRDCLTLQTSSVQEREAWTHDIAQLLWTHAMHNTGQSA